MRTIWAGICVSLLLTATGACSKSSGLPEGQVKVLDEGDLGKAIPLQLSFQEGSVQTADAKMTMRMKMRVEGKELGQPMTMTLGYRMGVDKVETRGGDRIGHLQMSFTKMAMPRVPSRIARQLEGMKMQVAMNQTGKQEALKIDNLPAGLPGLDQSQFNRILQNIYPSIPAKPVGPGGSWKIKKTADMPGGKLTVIAQYTLVKVEKNDKGVVAHLKLDGKVAMKLSQGGNSGKLGGKFGGTIVYVPAMARVLHSTAEMKLSGEVSAMGTSVPMSMEMSLEQHETSWTTPKER